jgi:hypothetical protein
VIRQLIVLLAVIISGEMFRITATPVEICVVAEQSKETNRNSKAEKPDVFANVRPTLRKATDVPLRLPEFIPDVSSDNPAYAILESVDRHNYEVQLAWSSDCNGGNACHYGAVRGSINPLLAERFRYVSSTALKAISSGSRAARIAMIRLWDGVKGNTITLSA